MGIFGALAAGAAGVAAGIAWARRRVPDLSPASLVLRVAPRVDVSALRESTRAKITGVAEADVAPLALPFGDGACLGYMLKVWQRKHGRGPFIAASSESSLASSFFVRDSTGVARVSGKVEALAFERVELDESIHIGRHTPSVHPGLERFLKLRSLRLDRETQIEMRVLRAGDYVSVFGVVMTESVAGLASSGFRGSERRALLTASRFIGLTISNMTQG